MKPCRRCLIDAPDGAALLEAIRARLDSLPDDQKAPQSVYENRLAACQRCDQLVGGTCRQCGCFVLLRAAKRAMGCPAPQPKWTRWPDSPKGIGP